MNRTRTRIANHVNAYPGVHFNELVRALDLAPGQVQHHIRRLIADDAAVSVHLYGRTHYYPPSFDPWEQATLALFRRETTRDVLGYLLKHESARPAEVADELGVARSTLEWHLDHLVEQDIVRKERNLHNHVTLVLARPEETAELLAEVSPSLPERFVDRFSRLVDSLLAE
ncbi:MAG: winged helix-turn-helix transcriptional regulator [Halobacteriota archaeon]